MKLKKITLTFPEPLTKTVLYQGQEVSQEDILYTDLEGIRAKVRSELTRVLKGIDIVRKFGLDFFLIITVTVEGIQCKMDCMMAWKRDETNPCVYYIFYPMDMESLLVLKDLGSRLPILGKRLKNKDLHIARILQEKKLIEGMKKFSFAEMQINPELVIITSEEVEGAPPNKDNE